MHDAVESFMVWLGGTSVSTAIASSRWMFPAGETLHFVGLAMLFGFVAALDLRMLGIGKQIPLAVLHRFLPWGVTGFGLTLATGVLFIVAAPDQYLLSGVFWAKILFIALAGANVLLFYASGIYETVESLGPGEDAPGGAKAIAATSLFLWVGVMFWGRMLPFLGIAF
jgi:hypothetical protein